MSDARHEQAADELHHPQEQVRAAGADSVTEAELIRWSKDRMAGYKAPRTVVFLDALPLGATGKVQKDLLR